MPTYTIYCKGNGEIDTTGMCSDRGFDQAAFEAVYERQDKGVWIGEQLDHELVIFVGGEPVARATPYRPSNDELEAEIDRERVRRIAAGKVIDGVYVTGRDEDARNLINLAMAAQLRISMGDATTVTIFRDGNNVDHELSPSAMLSLWQQSSEYVSELYAASWALKALDPIPLNFIDNSYWPGA